jgi:hypothetical protein
VPDGRYPEARRTAPGSEVASDHLGPSEQLVAVNKELPYSSSLVVGYQTGCVGLL